MIVVEGMDSSGKSTLCEQLGKDFQLDVVHSTGTRSEEQMFARSHWMIRYSPAWHILDRFHVISDQVYGEVIRHHNPFASRRGEIVVDQFLSSNPLIIYCRPDSAVILDELGKKDQMEGVIPHAPSLIDKYDELIGKLYRRIPNNVIAYNYRDETGYQAVAGRVEAYLGQA